MKKMLILVIALSVLMMMSVTASARDRQDDDHRNNNDDNKYRTHHYSNDTSWHRTHRDDFGSERGLPFSWHGHYNSMREHHQLERLYDREWDYRFPGLHAYRWYGQEGFWHHGHYVRNAVLFFDRNHELVSVGYIANGVFIHFRADHESYENHDSFFLSWVHH